MRFGEKINDILPKINFFSFYSFFFLTMYFHLFFFAYWIFSGLFEADNVEYHVPTAYILNLYNFIRSSICLWKELVAFPFANFCMYTRVELVVFTIANCCRCTRKELVAFPFANFFRCTQNVLVAYPIANFCRRDRIDERD
jgi:hypothetical protein